MVCETRHLLRICCTSTSIVSWLLPSNGSTCYNMNPEGKEVDYEEKEEMEKEEEDNTA
jgi:hypothetical protein